MVYTVAELAERLHAAANSRTLTGDQVRNLTADLRVVRALAAKVARCGELLEESAEPIDHPDEAAHALDDARRNAHHMADALVDILLLGQP